MNSKISPYLTTLVKVGVHIGHKTSQWNPRIRPYIYGSRSGMHILDLRKTAKRTRIACAFVKYLLKREATFIFLGTQYQSSEPVLAAAVRSNSFYVNQRWLGGTFTNWSTIRSCVHRLTYLNQCAEDGTFKSLPKREESALRRQHARLKKYLDGLCGIEELPSAIIITGQLNNTHALSECRKCNVPIIGILDSNCDPTTVDLVIPANDDSFITLDFILTEITYTINLVTKAKQKVEKIKLINQEAE